MPEVNGCNIPDDIYYWPEKHVWVRSDDNETCTVGVTDVAQHLAKAIISALPKGAGRKVQRGKSLGTIESGKWVGPVTAPISGEVIEANPLLSSDPGIINRDPYGDGWYARLKPDDWEGEKATLVTGDEGVASYQAFLDSEGISCAD